MNFRKGFCLLVLLAVVAIQPALAAGSHPAKPAETAQLVDVPMKGLAVNGAAEKTLQTTPGDDVGFDLSELFSAKRPGPGGGTPTSPGPITDTWFAGWGI